MGNDTGELQSLADHGIAEIGLSAAATENRVKLGKNVVLATATFRRANGTTGTIGDVAFAFDPSSTRWAPSEHEGSLGRILASKLRDEPPSAPFKPDGLEEAPAYRYG